MKRTLSRCAVLLLIALINSCCAGNAQETAIAPVSTSVTESPQSTISLPTFTATATDKPWPDTFPPETYPTWEPCGLPPFLSDVWPPPDSEVRFEDYDPYIMFNGHHSWGVKHVGIGVAIFVNEIVKPTKTNEDEKYLINTDLFINDTKISNTIPTCIYMGLMMFQREIDELTQEDIHNNENSFTLERCNWEMRLSPDTYDVRLQATSPYGEVFEYSWQFTILAPGEI